MLREQWEEECSACALDRKWKVEKGPSLPRMLFLESFSFLVCKESSSLPSMICFYIILFYFLLFYFI